MSDRTCIKTCKGRVVYDRKFHPFTCRDVYRIANRTAKFVIISYPEDKDEQLQAFIEAGLQVTIAPTPEEEQTTEEETAKGGEFGGGGASGSYDSERCGYLFIKEEAIGGN